jgi:hypothetical protein
MAGQGGTATSLRCRSLPVGFAEEGAALGVRLVAGSRQASRLLQFECALEQALANGAGAVASVEETA